MGLAERRVTQDFQTNELPKLQSQVDEAAGYTLPIEVRWNNLAPDGEAHLFKESWKAIYFEPLIAALKAITQDEMGREALKSKLRNVVIQNVAGHYYADRWATFEGDSLILDHLPTTSIPDSPQRAASLVHILERNL